jgi:pilus assembly protein CpaE
LSNLLTRHDSGLHVLAAPTQHGRQDRISTKPGPPCARALRTSYDYIVVDTRRLRTSRMLSAFDENRRVHRGCHARCAHGQERQDVHGDPRLLNLATGHRYLVLKPSRTRRSALSRPTSRQSEDGASRGSSRARWTFANSTNHGRPIVLSKRPPRSRAIRELGRRLATKDNETAPRAVSDERSAASSRRRRLEIA